MTRKIIIQWHIGSKNFKNHIVELNLKKTSLYACFILNCNLYIPLLCNCIIIVIIKHTTLSQKCCNKKNYGFLVESRAKSQLCRKKCVLNHT